MRNADDPSVIRFEINWREPGLWPVTDWTTGWFWWRGYGTPAFATVTVGVAGEITFPLVCRWADGAFYQMFSLRYDSARKAVDTIHQDYDSHEFTLDGDSVDVPDLYVESGDFSPDTLFSEIASILDVALLTVKQATEYADAEVANKPDDDEVWVPVDVGQGAVDFATDDELA